MKHSGRLVFNNSKWESDELEENPQDSSLELLLELELEEEESSLELESELDSLCIIHDTL
ncbi:hypothetical protein A3Q56_02102 [Intoshia linei]|uniref:Uncharacterized protein n=1 Tax=Intoshia linei TaxID=1819745 RepID=A0A177B770_9BILA|nr:hypothetical protein A3Q56_02102 [Intoshia linei]